MRGFWQRSGSVVFVQSDKSEKAAGDSHLLPASATRSNDVDSDCNGCAPAPFHMGIDGYDVLQEDGRSEEHTSELQSLMRSSYAVFCLKKKKQKHDKRIK